MYSGKSNYSDDQLAREMLWMCDSVVLLCQVSIDMQILRTQTITISQLLKLNAITKRFVITILDGM